MKKVILQGFLAEEFGREWEIKADYYSEIFSCIDANYSNFRSRLIEYYLEGGDLSIKTGEELSAELELEDLFLPVDADTIYITPVPTGSKSGGAKILAAVAIVGLMFIPGVNAAVLAGLGTIASGGFSLTGLVALTAISLSVNLALTGLQQLMAPDPSVDQEEDQDYLFNGPQDVVASGNPVPILVGEMIIGGIVMSAGVIPGLPGAAGHIGGYPAGSGGFVDLPGGLSGGLGGSVDEFLWDNSYLLSGALDQPQADYVLYSEATITKPWTARNIPTGVSYIAPVTPHDIPPDLWTQHNAAVNLYQHSPDIDWSTFEDEVVGTIPTQASLFRTLTGASLSAEADFGSNNVSASLFATLDSVLLEAEASQNAELSLALALDSVGINSVAAFTGLSEIAASLEATLAGVSMTSTASAEYIATLTSYLDAVSISAEAVNEYLANLSVTIDGVTLSSTAEYTAGGTSRTVPTFKSASSVVASTTVSRPSGVVSGDVLIGIFQDFGSTTLGIPSGWTAIGSQVSGAFDLGIRAAYKVAGPSEPSSYTFTTTTNDYPASNILAFSNVDTTTTIADFSSNGGGGTAPSVPILDIINDNSAIVLLTSGYNPDRSLPSGFSERADIFTTKSYSLEDVDTGTYGPISFADSEETWAVVGVVLNGAPS